MIAKSGRCLIAVSLSCALAGCQAESTNRPIVLDTSDGQALPQTVITGGASQANFSRSITVPAGTATKLNFFAFTNPDCSNVGYATVREVVAPQHGSIEIVQAEDFGFWNEKNPRSECNKKRVKGVLVRYHGNAGFTGTDTVTYDMFGPTTGMRRFTLTVNVL